jgi:phage replication O-like protein O
MATVTQATFPGFPFPNTTQIPNDVFDSLMPSLSGGELKVLLYICRRTFGFQKDSDRISLSQITHGITTKAGRVLDHGTGLCKRRVITALKALEKKNIIIITREVDETGLNAVNTYRLNIIVPGREEESPEHQEIVNESAPGVVNSRSPEVVHSSAPTKQREQKKEEQSKEYDDGVTQALENFGMTTSAIPALLERYPAAYIKGKLAMTRGLLAAGSELVAKNPAGWLRRAIEENYQPPRKSERRTYPSGTPKQENKETHKEQKREQNSIITPVTLPQPDRQTERIWEQTIERLQHDLPAGETKNRLTGTLLLEVTETKAVILVPTRTAGAWLERRLYGQITKAMQAVTGKNLDLQFIASEAGFSPAGSFGV